MERAHGDGIKVSTESPEAFEEVFWKTFNHYEDDSIEKFKIYINNILKKSNKKRYISKNNQNIKRVKVGPKQHLLRDACGSPQGLRSPKERCQGR